MAKIQASLSVRSVFDTALHYLRLGLSLLPIAVDGSKRPRRNSFDAVYDPVTGVARYPWRHLRDRLPTSDEIFRWFGDEYDASGVGIITGAISGNLEVIDCDSKEVAAEFEQYVRQWDEQLLTLPVVVESPRGRHYYMRSPLVGKTAKLAMAPGATGDNKRPTTLIDFKAAGSYIIAPPSGSECHPARKPYLFAGPRTFDDLVVVTAEQRGSLIGCARMCNRIAPPTLTYRPKAASHRIPRSGRPGDDFDARGTWDEVLTPFGWKCVGCVQGVTNWRRPGKNAGGHSATTGFGNADLLHVFSTSASPFELDRWYTKFHAYALLRWDGNFSNAARDLAAQGYGGAQPFRSEVRGRNADLGFTPRSIRK